MLGIYEKSMPDTLSLAEKLRIAKEAKFDFLELSVDESQARLERLCWSKAQRTSLRRQSEDIALPILTMCLSGHRKYPLGSPDLTTRTRGMDILKNAIDFSVCMGIRVIQLAGYDVYYEPGTQATQAYFAENLRLGTAFAASGGVTLALETMETPFMNTVEKAMHHVKEVNSPFLQIYPDLGNVFNGAAQPLADLALGRGHIVAAHLKESRPGVFRNLFYGEGRVDFASSIAVLQSQGVHLFNCEIWDRGEDPLTYLTRAQNFFAPYGLAKHTMGTSAQASPQGQQEGTV